MGTSKICSRRVGSSDPMWKRTP